MFGCTYGVLKFWKNVFITDLSWGNTFIMGWVPSMLIGTIIMLPV
jgi:hypothetical protein